MKRADKKQIKRTYKSIDIATDSLREMVLHDSSISTDEAIQWFYRINWMRRIALEKLQGFRK